MYAKNRPATRTTLRPDEVDKWEQAQAQKLIDVQARDAEARRLLTVRPLPCDRE